LAVLNSIRDTEVSVAALFVSIQSLIFFVITPEWLLNFKAICRFNVRHRETIIKSQL